ncbi:hypothetical protein MTBGP_11510 [Moorella thermoacetica]|uniref:AAA family ATPase n=1 Tax=Neomoorella thermoacetica TaxID=1525 RepID=UPI0030D5D316
MGGLEEKVKRMAEYLDADAISAALKIPVETVQDILDGKAQVQEVAGPFKPPAVVQVNSARVAYRQRVIAVWRAKGGVGCTAVALYLAWLLKDMLRVLLIDLNLDAGGSDLSYYLGLPEYPHLGGAGYGLETSLINVQDGFYVLQAPRRADEIKVSQGMITGIINAARPAFDVIIMDLPNNTEEHVIEAVSNATTIVFVTTGGEQELLRIALKIEEFKKEENILVANGGKIGDRAAREIGVDKVVSIPWDGSLQKVLEGNGHPQKGSPFMEGVEALRDILYEHTGQKGGILKKLFMR